MFSAKFLMTFHTTMVMQIHHSANPAAVPSVKIVTNPIFT